MCNKLNLTAEPFEFNPEYDETSDLFNGEIFEMDWEGRGSRKRRKPTPLIRSKTRTAKARKPYRSAFRPIKPPFSKFKPVKPLFSGFATPPFVAYRPDGRPLDGVQPDNSRFNQSDNSASAGAPPENGQAATEGSEYNRWVQSTLNRVLGLNLPLDGIMGTTTRSAIRSFQKKQGLPVDGIVGPSTAQSLNAAGNAKPYRAPVVGETGSRPLPVESPGGGRITNKKPPNHADLVTVAGVGGKIVQLHKLAAEAWKALVDSARNNGIKHPLLLPTSGYRSPQKQNQLWEEALKKHGTPQEARKWVAPPGTSAHQSGRAIDLYLGGENKSNNVDKLRTLPAYKWMVANAKRFGFYPYTREPWHWEYNPPANGQLEFYADEYDANELWDEHGSLPWFHV